MIDMTELLVEPRQSPMTSSLVILNTREKKTERRQEQTTVELFLKQIYSLSLDF